MSTLTASHARALAIKHDPSEEAIYDHINKICDQRIKDVTKKSEHINFVIPGYIFGLPLFDPQSMFLRLYRSLTERDFEVYRTDKPLELYITWRKRPVKPRDLQKPTSFEKLSKLRREIDSKKSR